jgi:glycosyltransferase involved in cell wall biosynthesis
MPTVSVIIPTYQHATALPACLDSVLVQTYSDMQIIVVDDGSTDATQDVLSHYTGRITIIQQENQGSNAARNNGAAQATGTLLLFCDADVVLEPNCVARMVQALADHPTASYAYSAFVFGWKKFPLWEFSAEKLRKENYIHTTSLIRREHFPGFDVTLKRMQDWDLWLTMLERQHTGVWIPDVLFRVSVVQERSLMNKSAWLPSFMYRIPWSRFGIHIPAVEAKAAAEAIVRKKHHLQ